MPMRYRQIVDIPPPTPDLSVEESSVEELMNQAERWAKANPEYSQALSLVGILKFLSNTLITTKDDR